MYGVQYMTGILEYAIIISFLIGAMAGATTAFYYIGWKLKDD